MISGHLLSDLLHGRLTDSDGQSNRGMDSDIAERKNQGYLKAIDVLSWFGQDCDEEVDLTSDQKVGGSWPSGCIKNLSKSSHSKSQIPYFQKFNPRRYTFAICI